MVISTGDARHCVSTYTIFNSQFTKSLIHNLQMPLIKLQTEIDSSLEICFDLARSIDLHTISTAHTKEKAIEGKTTGLIGLGEYVTFEATHFGIKQHLSAHITAYERPYYFKDELIKGAFKSLTHIHQFEYVGDKVLMTDWFEFESPLGFLGKLVNYLFLTKYMTKLLSERNRIIKEFAESGRYKEVLNLM